VWLFRRNIKIDFIIIGAQKAGTSALYSYMAQHPLCVGSSIKEVNYFSSDCLYEKGEIWYSMRFPFSFRNFFKKQRYFEASPNYFYLPFCANRIYQHNPSVKLIVLLRDPVDRAFSSWNMFRNLHQKGSENVIRKHLRYANPEIREPLIKLLTDTEYPSFEDCVELELYKLKNGICYTAPNFVKLGLYYEQLLKYYAIFPDNQILIIQDIELKYKRIETLDKVCEFLGIPKTDWGFASLVKKHKGSYIQCIEQETETRLRSFYEPYDRKLEKLISRDVYWLQHGTT